MSAHYIFTVERDTREQRIDSRPISWEQYLDGGVADFESVQAKANRVHEQGYYGKVRIARLAYIDEDADLVDALDRIANLYDHEATTIELASAMYDARCIALSALAKLKEA